MTERSAQRERTRAQIIDGARELLDAGQVPSVQTVTEHTGISRATVYRYFSTNESLLLHASAPLTDDVLIDEAWAYHPGVRPSDLPERAEATVRSMGAWAFDREQNLRTLLRLSLRPDAAEKGFVRRGRTMRHRWIRALANDLPPEITAPQRRRLEASLHALFGSDAVVWTTDMAGLSRHQALDVLGWMAAALLRQTLAEAGVAQAP